MKNTKLVLSIVLMAALSACAGKKNSDEGVNGGVVTEDGRCTSEILDVSNNMLRAMNALRQAQEQVPRNVELIVNRAIEVRDACDRMLPKYAGVSCKAESQGKVVDLRTDDVKEYCATIKEILRSNNL
ncbi:hypothetical protein [Bdellovibrio sp. HCB-162]|uniref:hypothetical protein n=1 Tax=Bdellovibrio sp. HCB-162 TaxID=3394234 RepID=UPI0039BCD100